MLRTITLCGSARFETEFRVCMKYLTMNGVTCIGLGSYPSDNDGEKTWYTDAQKELFDLVHFGKVSQADVVLVIDCHFEPTPLDLADKEPLGYVGYSTAREIVWSAINGKPVAFLSDLLRLDTSIIDAMEELTNVTVGKDIQVMPLAAAMRCLEVALGRDQAKKDELATEIKTMHAALSSISEFNGVPIVSQAPDVAKDTLRFIGLDPMAKDERNAYLKLIDPNSSTKKK